MYTLFYAQYQSSNIALPCMHKLQTFYSFLSLTQELNLKDWPGWDRMPSFWVSGKVRPRPLIKVLLDVSVGLRLIYQTHIKKFSGKEYTCWLEKNGIFCGF